MAMKYFIKLNEIISKIYPNFPSKGKIEVKHFFSGAAVYVDGKICISLTPKGLAVKLPNKYI